MWAEGGCKANSEPGYLDCNLYPSHPISRADTRPWELVIRLITLIGEFPRTLAGPGVTTHSEGRGWSQVCAVSHHQHCSPSLWLQLLIERESMGERRKMTQRCCRNVHTQIRTSEANLCTFNFLQILFRDNKHAKTPGMVRNCHHIFWVWHFINFWEEMFLQIRNSVEYLQLLFHTP